MELKDFIKGVLKDITEAVKESKNENFEFRVHSGGEYGIDFDLAVVLKQSADGKIGAEIFSVIGAKVSGNISEEKVNRIKFKVIPQEK